MIENLFLFPAFDLKLSFQRSRKIFERFNPGGMTKKYNKKTFGMHRIQNFKWAWIKFLKTRVRIVLWKWIRKCHNIRWWPPQNFEMSALKSWTKRTKNKIFSKNFERFSSQKNEKNFKNFFFFHLKKDPGIEIDRFSWFWGVFIKSLEFFPWEIFFTRKNKNLFSKILPLKFYSVFFITKKKLSHKIWEIWENKWYKFFPFVRMI